MEELRRFRYAHTRLLWRVPLCVYESLVRDPLELGMHIKYLPFGDSLTGEVCQVLNQLCILEEDQPTTTVNASDLDTGVVARKWAAYILKGQLCTPLAVFGVRGFLPSARV